MLRTKKLFASLCATGLLGLVGVAPAAAQPVVTGGLVNVTLVDVVDLEIREVQVAVNAAANICDTDILVGTDGVSRCTAIVGNRQNQ